MGSEMQQQSAATTPHLADRVRPLQPPPRAKRPSATLPPRATDQMVIGRRPEAGTAAFPVLEAERSVINHLPDFIYSRRKYLAYSGYLGPQSTTFRSVGSNVIHRWADLIGVPRYASWIEAAQFARAGPRRVDRRRKQRAIPRSY